MKVEVLVAALEQNPYELIEKMNIDTDMVIANQGNEDSIVNLTRNERNITIINTTTRGVGLNRNLAISFSSADADILLMADCDTVYYDKLKHNVQQAFKREPDADMIIFDLDFVKSGVYYGNCKNRDRKLPFYQALRYGTAFVAIKRNSLLRANIKFSELFGGGAMFCSGEDSLFIIACYRAGLKIYTSSCVIGINDTSSSTWFTGYDERHFYDKGAFSRQAFGKLGALFNLYYALRTEELSALSFRIKMQLMRSGSKNYRNLVSYKEFARNLSN